MKTICFLVKKKLEPYHKKSVNVRDQSQNEKSNTYRVSPSQFLLKCINKQSLINKIFIQNCRNKLIFCTPNYSNILVTFENEVKIIRNCLIISVIFMQNNTRWVYI